MVGMARGGISRERTMDSNVRIRGSGIRDGRRCGELMTLCRDDAVLICWDGDAGGGQGGQGGRQKMQRTIRMKTKSKRAQSLE